MACRIGPSLFLWSALALFTFQPIRAESRPTVSAIVCASQAPYAESLAAREVRRYAYLRSGQLLPILEQPVTADGGLILVGSKDRPAVKAMLDTPQLRAAVEGLAPEQYLLRRIVHRGQPVVLVVGGDPIGTLYAAYRLAEHWGVRFAMHGDVIPDRRPGDLPAGKGLELPEVDELGKPLFDRRGIQPFHDFPEGPDWWNADGYKAVLGQLPKMRMNFFGLHTYPEGGVGPEPLVWIGKADDLGPSSRVKFSYPSRHFTTLNGTWGYQAMRTGDYTFGAAGLFDRDDYGVDYMQGMSPWPKTPEASNELFRRMGDVLRDAFGFARRLGIKTCVGTETPLLIPTPVRERLKAAGKDPAKPEVVQEVYEAMFRRIAQTHPLDYYWFWTPEGWTWTPVTQQQIDATLADLRAAMAAAKKVKAPFTLATCGWVLGPPLKPALFDEFLPKDMPMSCISRQVGHEPVEPGFAKVKGRPTWAIPWMEDDPALSSVQLWAGRMRKDAADALAYGCTGLLGIHWRTRILGPNVSALADAAWDQKAWNPAMNRQLKAAVEKAKGGRKRFLPVEDFYADWALAHFGPEAAKPIGQLFAGLDGYLPRPADWVHGPGGNRPDPRPWQQVAKEYAFVDELAEFSSGIQGEGNRERFDYWLNSFRYLRAMAQVNCTWARFNEAMKAVKAQKSPEAQKRLARERALPVRKELVAQVGQVHGYLLATITTYGELGTVANWQQHILPDLLVKPGQELAKIFGEPLPADAMPGKEHRGEPRLVVPTVRTNLTAGERLNLEATVIGPNAQEVAVYWRPLGAGQFAKVPCAHMARGVYAVTLPAEATKADLEYYVSAKFKPGELADRPHAGAERRDVLKFPATAPAMNQTVVVVGAE